MRAAGDLLDWHLSQQVLANLAAVDDLDRAGRRGPSVPCRRRCPAGGRRWWPGRPGRPASLSGSRGGGVRRAVDRCRLLMPPPASTTLNTFGQWSRPAVCVDLRRAAEFAGDHDQRRRRAGRCGRDREIRAAKAWSKAGIWPLHAAGDAGVHVPAAVGQRDEPHAGRHQPAGHQHPLAGLVAAVFVAERGRLGVDIERLAGLPAS